MICPVCGFDLDSKDQEQYKKFLLSKFDSETKKNLLNVYKVVSSILQSENIHKFNAFLYRIANKDKVAITEMIEKYMSNEMYAEGKGFLYLASMIDSWNKNRTTVLQFEKKKYGMPPLVKELNHDGSDK